MEFAMTIVACFIVFMCLDLIFLAFVKGIDYCDKGNHKKVYRLQGFKFVMIRYKRIIKPWKIEKKEKTISSIDSKVSQEISRLSFWLQIFNLIIFLLAMSGAVLRAMDSKEKILFPISMAMLAIMTLLVGITFAMKNKAINEKIHK